MNNPIHNRSTVNNRRGFTLIEVLVAIAIIAIVVPALMLLMMQQTDFAGALRDKTIAHWIAENKATELRLKRHYLKELLRREQTEKVEMAGTEWTLDIDIEDTLDGALILYTIRVSRDTDEPITTLETFLHGN